jgi:methylaspartate ammonia-lyase
LSARASARKSLPCEVICAEYDLPLPTRRVPVFGQCGDNRYENADKMIIKQIDALSHGLINNVPEKLGRKGEKLQAYLQWLCRRIEEMKTAPSYRPTIHIDVYGTVGQAFKADVVRMADYLASLKKITGNLPLYIEGPADMGEKRLTMDVLLQLRKQLKKIGADVRIVADEWCNTLEDIRDFADEGVCDMIQIKTPDLGGVQDSIESVLYCRAKKIEPYLGGSCNETDISSRMTVQIGLATQASRILIKPGMGFDEGLCIMNNEMERTLAFLKSRHTVRR